MTFKHKVTKTYGHDLGLSVCFRQHHADSHCRFLHGYAIAVTIEVVGDTLDHRGWLVDFGGFKEVKKWLIETYDHTMLVAITDPEYHRLRDLNSIGVAKVIAVENVSMENQARTIAENASQLLDLREGTYVHSVTVSEHSGNSTTCYPPKV